MLPGFIGGSHFSVPTAEGLQAAAFYFGRYSAAREGSRLAGRQSFHAVDQGAAGFPGMFGPYDLYDACFVPVSPLP